MGITTSDWDTVDRQGYTLPQIEAREKFIAEYGEHYDTVADALADYYEFWIMTQIQAHDELGAGKDKA